MFKLISGQKVMSDEGFELELHLSNSNNGWIVYRQGMNELRLGAGYEVPPGGRFSFSELPVLGIEVPRELVWSKGSALDTNQSRRVLNDIRRTLEFMQAPARFLAANNENR